MLKSFVFYCRRPLLQTLTYNTTFHVFRPLQQMMYTTSIRKQRFSLEHTIEPTEEEPKTTQTIDSTKVSLKSFSQLGLNNTLAKTAVFTMQFEEPTEIQKRIVSKILKRKNVVASAETGTGKTAAYGLPILQLYYEQLQKEQEEKIIRDDPLVLILVPTKELAEQTQEHFMQFSKDLEEKMRLRIVVVTNRESKEKQLGIIFKGVDILIGTPGRVLELLKIENTPLKLNSVKHLILDECDRMLSLGFLPDVRDIYRYLPKRDRKNPENNMQLIALSATVMQGVEDFVKRFAPRYSLVHLNENMDVAQTVKHIKYYVSSTRKKRRLLIYLLKRKASFRGHRVLVFVRTKQRAERLAASLQEDKFKAECITSDHSPTQRAKAIERFRNSETQVLISTDVLSRGIDIEKLPFVVNYDVPSSPEDYVHRCGRTGRAGHPGMAISFVSQTPQVIKVGMRPVELNEMHFMSKIEAFLGHKVEWRKVPGPWRDHENLFKPTEEKLAAKEESKREAFKLLEKKREKEKRILENKGKQPEQESKISKTYAELKSLMFQRKAQPEKLYETPLLRNFKEGRYEDVIKEFDKKRAIKRGIVVEPKKKWKSKKKKKLAN